VDVDFRPLYHIARILSEGGDGVAPPLSFRGAADAAPGSFTVTAY
jgi:hypothetical protein